jgi:thiamine kinase-like enzyme
MQGNSAMKELKLVINYDFLVMSIQNFPEILEGSRSTFETVRDETRKSAETGEELIHGDFWTGNILLPNRPLPAEDQPVTVYVIDWELSHLSSIAFDLGQMFAE